MLTTQDLPRPAPALDLEFWRLVVDLLIALLIGTHRTQQFDQLPRDYSHFVLCMHACMTVTVNCPVSVFFVLLTKKFHVHIMAAHNT